jgi:hypothetical protein
MKGNGFLLVTIFGISVSLVSNATAGPAVSSGPAQPDSGGPVYAPATQIPSGVSPGLNARDSVASQSGAPSQTSSANSSSNPSVSSGDQNSSTNPYSSGFSNINTVGVSNSTGSSREKVVEISEKDLAAESAKNQEKSEVTKKFEASILNQGVDEIAKPSAPTKSTDSRAQNPVTGAALQSAASEGAGSSRQNSTESAASAATSPHP